MKKTSLALQLALMLFIFSFMLIIPYYLLFTTFWRQGLIIISIFWFLNLAFIYDAWINRRSDKQSKISWTILLSWPLPLFLIYLWSSKRFFWHRKKYIDINNLEQEIFQNNPLRKYTDNLDLKILSDGQMMFNSILDDLDLAKETIWIEFFILNEGISFNILKQKLIDKANQGVKIKILTDYAGNIQNNNKIYKDLNNTENIEFVIFNKIFLLFSNGNSNLRSHNKIIVIDSKCGYFGGFNIGDDYLSLYSKYGFWYDIHFKTMNLEFINDLKAQFILDWYKATNIKELNEIKKLDLKGTETNKITYQAFSDGYNFEEPKFLNKFISLIQNSSKSLKFVSPYLILPQSILKELINASQRGVKIEIITTGRADKKSAYYSSRYYLNLLSKNNIKIYRTNNFFLHAKYYIFDDKITMVGTSNLDSRSIYLHYEYNFVIWDQKIADKLILNSWNELLSLSTLTNYEKNLIPSCLIKFISPIL